MLFQKLQSSQRNTSQKAEERQVFWGTGRVHFPSQSVEFWSNHSGNKVKPMNLTASIRLQIKTGFLRAVQIRYEN